MVVEDVCLATEAPGEAAAGGRWVRRLVFEANRSLVQSEAALAAGPGPLDPAPAAAGGAPGGGGPGDARKGKKGKKRGGGGGGERAGGAGAAAGAEAARPARVDHSVLCSAYHAAIVAGLALTGGRPRRSPSSLRCAHAAAVIASLRRLCAGWRRASFPGPPGVRRPVLSMSARGPTDLGQATPMFYILLGPLGSEWNQQLPAYQSSASGLRSYSEAAQPAHPASSAPGHVQARARSAGHRGARARRRARRRAGGRSGRRRPARLSERRARPGRGQRGAGRGRAGPGAAALWLERARRAAAPRGARARLCLGALLRAPARRTRPKSAHRARRAALCTGKQPLKKP